MADLKAYLDLSDFNSASDEEKIEILNRIIEQEIQKPDSSIDNDLIKECSDFIRDLLPSSEKATSKQLDEIKEKVKNNSIKENGVKSSGSQMRKKAVRIISAIAASFVIMIGALFVVSALEGYSSSLDFVKAKVSDLLKLFPGNVETDSNITVTINGNLKKYKSLEQFVADEKLDIVLPHLCDDPDAVSGVLFTKDESQSTYQVIIQLSGNYGNIIIRNKFDIDMSKLDYLEEVRVLDDMSFYIMQIENGGFQALAQYKSNEYVAFSNNYDDLLSILQRIKED